MMQSVITGYNHAKGVFIKYGVEGGVGKFSRQHRKKFFDPPHRVCQKILTHPRGGLKISDPPMGTLSTLGQGGVPGPKRSNNTYM